MGCVPTASPFSSEPVPGVKPTGHPNPGHCLPTALWLRSNTAMTLPSPGTHVLEDTETGLAPLFHLILLDDDDHTYQYVIHMLGAIFGYSREKAFAIACSVDAEGQAILMTGGQDELSARQEQVHSFGPDPAIERSMGSMSAVIEPVA